MIALPSSSSSSILLRSIMLRQPSIMSTVAKSNLLKPCVVRAMSSCVATSKTTTATSERNLYYGNDMNQSVWQDRPNTGNHKNVVRSTTIIGNTNYNLPVADQLQSHSKIPSNNHPHRYRTHINSTAINPNGGYVMFTL